MDEMVALIGAIIIGFSGLIVVTAQITRYKLKKKELEVRGSDSVDALRDDVEQLADTQEHTRVQLAEMQERLDFTERVLAAGRESQENRSE